MSIWAPERNQMHILIQVGGEKWMKCKIFKKPESPHFPWLKPKKFCSPMHMGVCTQNM